jgi:hypothetical protein
LALTPQITLQFSLLDYSGAQIGSATQPAWLRIALCGFGQTLPCIPGTGMVGKVSSWFTDIPYLGVAQDVPLWGNDVIAPLNQTFYAISILDANKNVLQTGLYKFTGTQAIDLSNASQITQPPNPQPNNYNFVPFSPTMIFSGAGVTNMVIFDTKLTGNAMAPVVANIAQGCIAFFFISQDATGSRTFNWPANVKNPPVVDPTPSSTTTAAFVMRADGSLYPWLGWS